MPDTATTILADSASNDYPSLSDDGVLECIALSAGSDAETAVATNESLRYSSLSDEQVIECAASMACDAAGYTDAEDALADAIASGYDRMSDRQLWDGILLYLS